MIKRHHIYGLLTIIFSLGYLCMYYSTVLFDLEEIFFQVGGDGYASYYNTIYHVLYDKEHLHSYSMNFPYGENSFFTGNFFYIKILLDYWPFEVNKIAAATFIINLSMLGSPVICAWSIYKIFEELTYKQTNVFNILASVGIAMLSPQISRFGGHYALSISFVIPLTLLFLIKLYKNPSFKISILFSVYITLSAIHSFYFFALMALCIGTFWMLYSIINYDKSKLKQYAIHVFLQLIIPFSVVKIIMASTDQVTDRTNNPWGFFSYHSWWEGSLLPIGKKLGNLISSNIVQIRNVPWEGVAYVGIASALFFIFLIVYHLIKYKKFGFYLRDKKYTLLLMMNIIGILSLLVSWGYPFTIKGFEFLLDYIGFARQLRAIGRFNWIFYYVINITTFYIIIDQSDKIRLNVKMLLTVMGLTALFYDAHWHNYKFQDTINFRVPEILDLDNTGESTEWIRNILPHKDEYSAIIPLPYLHVGSESTWIHHNSSVYYLMYLLGIKTGIPTYSVQMSRTSLSQTYKNVQLTLPPYQPLAVLNDIPVEKQKDFLLMVDDLFDNTKYNHLIKNAEKLFTYSNISFYRLRYETIENLWAKNKKHLIALSDSIIKYPYGDYYVTDTLSKPVFYNYNTEKTKGYEENCLALDPNTIPVIADFNYNFVKGKTYTVSFWLNNINQDLVARTEYRYGIYNSEGIEVSTMSKSCFNHIVAIDGNWALVEFQVSDYNLIGEHNFKLFVMNNMKENPLVLVDSFLFIEKGQQFIANSDSKIFINNRYY